MPTRTNTKSKAASVAKTPAGKASPSRSTTTSAKTAKVTSTPATAKATKAKVKAVAGASAPTSKAKAPAKTAASRSADKSTPSPAGATPSAAKAPSVSSPQRSASAARSADAEGTTVTVQESVTKKAKTTAAAPAAAPVPPPSKKAKRLPPTGPLTEETIREMDDEDYMNEAQLAFFRERLLQMRQEVLVREVDVKERLHQREVFADPADRATAEEEHWLDLRLRERESLLLRKIDEAIKRIADREYGYCEKTGDPIGIPRLLARPTATVCVDIKGQDERVEAQYRDR